MRDLSLHIMDIVQNSISASAEEIILVIKADTSNDKLIITICDDGAGMDEAMVKSITDPFVTTRTTRKVGLGIPLFKASANRAGGDLNIESKKGVGTTVTADFQISHIDRVPLGDLQGTLISLISGRPEIRFKLELSNGKESFELDTLEIKEKLGNVPITNYEVLTWIKEYVDEGIRSIFGGVLDEIHG